MRYQKVKMISGTSPWLIVAIFAIWHSIAWGDGVVCEGDDLEKSTQGDVTALQSAASLGNHHAQALLGGAYISGKGVAIDTEKGLSWLKQSAKGNDAEGKYLLGEYYLNKKSDNAGAERAIKLFKDSSDQGCVPATFYVGVLTMQGKGTNKDPEAGFRLALRAAERGYVTAQMAVAAFYKNGIGVPQDKNSAFRWAKAAADGGSTSGEIMLATFYLEGTGVDKDIDRAISMLEGAYNKKDAQASSAAYYLGWIYMDDTVARKDSVKAFRWLTNSIKLSGENSENSGKLFDRLIDSLPKIRLLKDCSAYMNPHLYGIEYSRIRAGEVAAILANPVSSDIASAEVYLLGSRAEVFISRGCLTM